MLLRAIEDKRFMPFGADQETGSDFQLICGTNQDLQRCVSEKKFREDLLSRINLWSFELPGLKDRPEDIEPNLDFELNKFSAKTNRHITFNKEARDLFLTFAISDEGRWRANFRDLNGAVTRMATLAPGGRITTAVVKEEIDRLKRTWGTTSPAPDFQVIDDSLGPERSRRLDRFERAQLADVLTVCKKAPSISEAGRILFSVSRENKKKSNDADRLRKYLAKYDIQWKDI